MGYIGEISRYAYDSVTNVNSVVLPVNIAAPVGTRIVLAVTTNPNSAVTGYTVSDSKGNTWTQRSFQVHSISNNSNLGVLECSVTAALTTSDTINVGNVSNLRSPTVWLILAQGFNDLSTGFDAQSSATGTSVSPSSGVTAPATQNGELVFGAVGFTGNPTFAVGSGYSSPVGSQLFATTTPRGLAVEWEYVDVSGTRSAMGTLSSAQGWCAAVTAFKQGAGMSLSPFCFVFDGTNDIPMDVTIV